MASRFVFNNVALYDLENDCWRVYPILDKRIPKTVECYGKHNCLGVGLTADDAIADARKNKVERWSVKVVKDE